MSKDISIQIIVEKYNEPNFLLTHYYTNSQETLGLACEGPFDLSIEESITNISLLGFDFESVFIFKNCNEESETSRIVYSIENGIELIEYSNGEYLKLNH